MNRPRASLSQVPKFQPNEFSCPDGAFFIARILVLPFAQEFFIYVFIEHMFFPNHIFIHVLYLQFLSTSGYSYCLVLRVLHCLSSSGVIHLYHRLQPSRMLAVGSSGSLPSDFVQFGLVVSGPTILCLPAYPLVLLHFLV